MAKWGLHERTTPEQARINRGRSYDGTNTEVEAVAKVDDVGHHTDVLQRGKLVHNNPITKR